MGKDFDKRGFKDLDEMHDFITKKWNTSVTNGDHVYILGDVCWSISAGNFEQYKKLLTGLNGVKHLILGNHDDVRKPEYRKLFEEITPYKEVDDRVNGSAKRVILSHYYIPFYNHHYRDAIMLHGHSHNSAESEMERRLTAMLQRQGFPCEIYNVGCMYPYIDYAPRTLQHIVDNFDKNSKYSRDVKDEDDYDNILQALTTYHEQYPMMRFGQSVVAMLGEDPFYMSDKEALQKICAKICNQSGFKKNVG
jgi:calcineurin-like phosphoesterase family protein